MKWMLVFVISLCWCGGEAAADKKKCATDEECDEIRRADWDDQKKHPGQPLEGSDKTFFDEMGNRPKPSEGMRTMTATSGGIRKECRCLNDTERTTLHNAFKWLFTNKTSPTSTMTRYQVFVSQHRQATAPEAHGGPCFPGFHREFLARFTDALKLYDPSVELCYWDSSLDSLLPNAAHSCLWTAEYWGNGNGYVTSGFAANLPAYPSDCASQGATLRRSVSGNSYLYNLTKLNTISSSCYTFSALMSPYSFSTFESYHGGPHTFVYGHMGSVSCSPNDPVFWFHHCFIDYLWDKCRQVQTSNTETDYPNGSGVPANHHYYDPMLPFQSKTCLDGLSNSYIPGIYSYADSPSNCTIDADCCGKALWCNNGTCTAAVRLNGQMKPGWTDSGCYIPNCSTGTTPRNINNVCTCSA